MRFFVCYWVFDQIGCRWNPENIVIDEHPVKWLNKQYNGKHRVSWWAEIPKDNLNEEIIVVGGWGARIAFFVQFSRAFKAEFKVVDSIASSRRILHHNSTQKLLSEKTRSLVLQQTMLFLWGSKIAVIPHKLTSENESQILSGADLVVGLSRQWPGSKSHSSVRQKSGIPCVHGGSSCRRILRKSCLGRTFQIDDEPSGGAPTCEDGAHLPFIAVNVRIPGSFRPGFFLDDGKKIGSRCIPQELSKFDY